MNSDNSDTSGNTDNTAVPITVAGYAKRLRNHYREVKDAIHSGVLGEPSNGNFTLVCRQLLADGLSEKDDRVFRQFFGIGKSDNLKNAIDQNGDKFRSVRNYLKGQSENTDIKRLNMIAVLTDFNPRPYSEFHKSADRNAVDRTHTPIPRQPRQEILGVRNPWSRERFRMVGFMLLAIISGFVIWRIASGGQHAELMQWQNDRYVEVGADAVETPEMPICKFDEKQFLVKQKKVGKNTVFFDGKKPIYWYVRDGGYAFFDHPGKYPMDRSRELKPVSTRIARDIQQGNIAVNY